VVFSVAFIRNWLVGWLVGWADLTHSSWLSEAVGREVASEEISKLLDELIKLAA